MTISADTLKILLEKGLDGESLLEVVRAFERDVQAGPRSAAAERTARYRARGGGNIPEDLRQAVFERDGHACVYCGSADYLQCDHDVPVSKGGETTMENLATACRVCNARKKDRDRKAYERSLVRGHSKDISAEVSSDNSTDSPSLSPEVSPRPPSSPTNLSSEPPIVPQKSGRKAVGPPEFEAAWLAYPHVKGRSSKTKAQAEWRKLDPETRKALPAAVAKFKSEGKDAKGEHGAAAMERWLRDGKFLDWLTGSALLDLPVEPWPGPAEFRADVVAQHGEEFARSYLDPSGWKNGADRHVLARTGMAADRMARELRPLLARHGMTVRHERATH